MIESKNNKKFENSYSSSTYKLESTNRIMDFKIENIIFNQIPALINLESVRTGNPIFDFIKMNKLLNDKQFSAFKEGYQSLK